MAPPAPEHNSLKPESEVLNMATATKNTSAKSQQSRNGGFAANLMEQVVIETDKLASFPPMELSGPSRELVAMLPTEHQSEPEVDHEVVLAWLEAILEPEANVALSAVVHNAQVARARAFASDVGEYLGMVNQDHGRDTSFDHKLYSLVASRDSVLAAYRKAGRKIREMLLYKQLVDDHYGSFGGTPILVAEFDEIIGGTPADIEFLDILGQIGQAGHFIWTVNVGFKFFGVSSWAELPTTPEKLKELAQSSVMSAYSQFRLKPWAHYVCLCMPGLYGTAPFDPDGNPATALPGFVEVVRTETNLVVNSAAAAMTHCIVRSDARTDWPVDVEGEHFGGLRERLVVMKLGADTREQRQNATTELAIPDSIELILVDKLGVTPAVAKQGSNIASFFGAATTARATRGLDPKGNADAEMLSRLPNVATACRFAHYLKAIHRGLCGCRKSAAEVETLMQTWSNQWVLQNSEGASEPAKAERPFRQVIVTVQKDPQKPGYLNATVIFVPHYRVTAIKTSILIQADQTEEEPRG